TSPAATPSPIAVAPKIAPPPTANIAVKSDSQERNIVVENALYRVEISNRGAVVKSWQLKNYKDDAKPQRVLDVVHPEASQQTGGWPFSLVLDDEQLQNAANGGLYQISADGTNLPAPADVDLTWSDGHLEVMKRFHFDHTYVVRVETSVKFNGNPIKAGLGWLGGFGDLTVTNPAPVETVTTYYSEGGKITNFPHKKLNPPLHGLINFGWLEFIAEPLFHGLKWLHNYIPNWGWAIVVLTLVINMLLFPLRISSYKTTLKMQRVAPEIKAIQEKYKKYSMRDPRKAEMNKEVMAI